MIHQIMQLFDKRCDIILLSNWTRCLMGNSTGVKFNRLEKEGPESGQVNPESFHIRRILRVGSQQ